MARTSSTRHIPATDWVRYRPKPWDFEVPILRYFDTLPPRLDDELYHTVLRDVQRQFNIPKQRPLHIDDFIRHFHHPEKSPGLPYTAMGLKQKRDVDTCYIKQYVHNLKYRIYKKCSTPCTAASRTTVARPEKFRLIWGYPAHMTYAEGMFAQPLINGFKRDVRSPYGLWVQFSKRHIRTLQAHRRHPSSQWLGLDWSRFDQRVPAWLIRDAFKVLWSFIDLTGYQYRGVPTHPHTLPRLMDRIVKYFINTPIKVPTGKVFRKKQGVPSGSYFTSLVNTIANSICTQYCLRWLGVSYGRASQWYMGDDGLVLLHSALDLRDFANVAKEKFGFTLNTEKTEIGTEVSFLGYRMTSIGRPQADYDKLLAQLLLPDATDRSESDFVTRAVALQLSCFGFGCTQFVSEVDQYLVTTTAQVKPLHPRNELRQKKSPEVELFNILCIITLYL